MDKGYIYGLACPLTGRVRYVGQTKNPVGQRCRQHLSLPAPQVASWLSDLAAQRLAPFPVVLDCVSLRRLDEAEAKWMRHFAKHGEFPLLNKAPAPVGGPTIPATELGYTSAELNAACVRKNLSNREISEATGVPLTTISRFCNGRCGLPMQRAEKVVRFIFS